MTDLFIDCNQIVGKIKPLHGVNNGPVSYHFWIDTSRYYKEIGVPYIRLHDTDHPSQRMVDVRYIFKNFEADENDPANYDFAFTDILMRKIKECGAETIYRLGASIEHTEKKYFVFPPEDFEKYARICLNIIRHYNSGWANGFQYDLKYFEIWNEPDLYEKMWNGGTPEQYYEFYEILAKLIKKEYPESKIGGYAGCNAYCDEYFDGFFEHIKKTGAPIDFFTYHIYADDVRDFVKLNEHVNRKLNAHGYPQLPVFLDEWNIFTGEFWESIMGEGFEYNRKFLFERIKNEVGAAFCGASLSLFQNLRIDAAMYYDGQPKMFWCGLFDLYGVPLKPYYPFVYFGDLYRKSNECFCMVGASQKSSAMSFGAEHADSRTKGSGESSGIFATAPTDGKTAGVLLSNYEGLDTRVLLHFNGMEKVRNIRIRTTDRFNTDRRDFVEEAGCVLPVATPKNSVIYLEFDVNES